MSEPLVGGWTKIAGVTSGDWDHSVYMDYGIAVNDDNPNNNPDIYITVANFYYRVMKGTYNTGSGTYTFSDIGGTNEPSFDRNNAPINLAVANDNSSDGNLYVASWGMSTSGTMWKFDGTNWTDINYGKGFESPSIAVSGDDLYALNVGPSLQVSVLWKGTSAWLSADLTPYLPANTELEAIAIARDDPTGNIFVLDNKGSIWEVTFGELSPKLTINSCTKVATAPSGGGTGMAVEKIGYSYQKTYDFYVTDASHKCVEALPSATNGDLPDGGFTAQNWVTMQDGASNSFNAPHSIALDGWGNLYVSDPCISGSTDVSKVVKRSPIPTQLVWSTEPGNSLDGNTLSRQPVLKLESANGNVETTNNEDGVTVTLTSGSGTLSGTQTVTLNAGVATFSNLSVTSPGDYTLTAACGGISSTSTSFTVSAKSTVTFIDSSKTYNTKTIASGSTLNSLPANPSKTGYTFGGWFTGEKGTGTQLTSDTTVNTDMTVYADWVPVNYGIIYDLGGGSVSPANPTGYTIESGDITLGDPTKANYTFAGWSGTDISGTSESVTIPAGSTGDRSYTANWTADTYSIAYDLGGGSVSPANPTGYTVESGDITLGNPTKASFTFAGWSGTDISGTSASVTIPAGSTGNRNYTANWTADTYSIIYNLNGGTNNASNPGNYTYGAGFLLATPTKTGYTFSGWYSDSTFQTPVTYVSGSQTGDVTVYANWLPITVSRGNITLDLSDTVLPDGVTSLSLGSDELPTSGTGSENYTLVLKLISSDASLCSVQHLTLYDIKLLDQNGNSIENFTGKIKVKIKIPDGMSGNLHVYWYDPDKNKLTDMNAAQDGNYLVFETSHFSNYAVAQLNTSTTPVSNPKTGDNTNTIPLAPFVMGGCFAAGLTIQQGRKKFRFRKHKA